jgi:hypothetical protein
MEDDGHIPATHLPSCPGRLAAPDSRPGMSMQRLSIHRDDWDEIPRRLAAGGGHVIRVDWFTAIPAQRPA